MDSLFVFIPFHFIISVYARYCIIIPTHTGKINTVTLRKGEGIRPLPQEYFLF